MSTYAELKYQIQMQTNITKLEFLRDYGLDMILADIEFPDFTTEDKTALITIINDRIAALQ